MRGSRLFKKHCAQCHSIDKDTPQGANIGPTLWNICGRCSGIYDKVGSGGKPTIENTIVWTDSMLLEYMKNPRAVTSGSIAMNFTGISKEQDRIDILAYLHTLVWPTSDKSTAGNGSIPYGQVEIFDRYRSLSWKITMEAAEAQRAQQQLMQLNAVIESQKMLVKLTGTCFEACVSAPGKDLSSNQQSCLWRCAQNSMESSMFMQRRLMQKAQEQH